MPELNVNPTNIEICNAIWQEVGRDYLRFYSSGYHGIDDENKVSLESFIEETFSDIDIGSPEDIGLQMDPGEFRKKINGMDFIADMCKFKYEKLKGFNKFDFHEQENWNETVIITDW